MILHIAVHNKFTGPLFKLMRNSFSRGNHVILSRFPKNEWPGDIDLPIVSAMGFKWAVIFSWRGYLADKIVLHGLFDPRIVTLLFVQPWLLRKCYWVIFGWDLYAYCEKNSSLKWRAKEFLRRYVIHRLGHLVTYIPGDASLAREWYGARGKYHECIAYPSNLFKSVPSSRSKDGWVNVQIGNSADPSNMHIEALTKLSMVDDGKIRVYVPLSYGDKEYANKVVDLGRALFGDRFFPLLDFMSLDEYMVYLSHIDIAIFNHRRQQGMGNLISLIGLGKKILLRPEVTSYEFFNNIGVRLFSIDEFDLKPIDDEIALNNKLAVARYFTNERLQKQWQTILGD